MGRREWILLLALAALWGSSFYFFKILGAELPPLTIVFGRVGLAAIILNLWLAWRGDAMPSDLKFWAALSVMGLLNNIVPFALIAFGETRISSGLASILNASTPLFTVLFAHIFAIDEKTTPAKIAGVAAGFLGVAALVGREAAGGDSAGQIACLCAAISYALAGLFGRRFRSIAPIKLATGQVTASALLLLPLVLAVDHPWSLAEPSLAAWSALCGIALLCTVLGYILYFRILAQAGATNLLLVTFLSPVAALALGAGLLGETVGLRQCLGMALIATGLLCIDGRVFRRRRG